MKEGCGGGEYSYPEDNQESQTVATPVVVGGMIKMRL